MDTESKPIRVAAVGMDDRMKHALHMFFQGPCKKGCILVQEELAEVAIIDLDGYQGKEVCDNYRSRHPEQHAILISLHETAIEDGVFLRKPLNTKELIKALKPVRSAVSPQILTSNQSIPDNSSQTTTPSNNIAAKDISRDKKTRASTPLTHHAAMLLEEQDSKILIGTAPDIDPNDPEQLNHVQYDPRDFLQNQIDHGCQTAFERKRHVRLDTSRGAIDFYPDGHRILVNFNESQLRTLSVVPIARSELSLSILDENEPKPENPQLITNKEALVWKTALWASRGRVPTGICLDTPVFIRRWPNMTRLQLSPHALRIAALWSQQPHSLLMTAKTLNIPQRHVFGFFSAAHALNLASTTRRAVDSLLEPTPLETNQRQNLFGRILNRLRSIQNRQLKSV